MKVRKKSPELSAIKWDGSKLALSRVAKLYKNVKQTGDNLIITTLDAVITVKPGGWIVIGKDSIAGYGEESFNKLFELVVENKTGGE